MIRVPLEATGVESECSAKRKIKISVCDCFLSGLIKRSGK